MIFKSKGLSVATVAICSAGSVFPGIADFNLTPVPAIERGRPQPAPMEWYSPYRGKDHAASSARKL